MAMTKREGASKIQAQLNIINFLWCARCEFISGYLDGPT